MEIKRLTLAQANLSEVTDLFKPLEVEFEQQLASLENLAEAWEVVQQYGKTLWKSAIKQAQTQEQSDDRPLYWARLSMGQILEQWLLDKKVQDKQSLIREWEDASRGRSSIHFPPGEEKKILISGFDPFRLDQNMENSNPSGAAVLALTGQRLSRGRTTAVLQGVLFPVRYRDFNEGVVEKFFKPYLKKVDMVMTVSMGGPDFALERFVGRCRSSMVADNVGNFTTAGLPLLGEQILSGPEFLESSLPIKQIRKESGSPFTIRDNRQVETIERGVTSPSKLEELNGQTAIRGSGGNYLSNEISYRTLLLREQLKIEIPMGHLHTPHLEGNESKKRKMIIEQIKRILYAALETL